VIKAAGRPVTLAFELQNVDTAQGSAADEHVSARAGAGGESVNDEEANGATSAVRDKVVSIEQSPSDRAQVIKGAQPVFGASGDLDVQVDTHNKSALALDMLQQALPRLHQLQEAHKYQLSMALQAATAAAEKQAALAAQTAKRHAEEQAEHQLQETRRAHVKHVQARVFATKSEAAEHHYAAALIQSHYRRALHRSSMRTVLAAHRGHVDSVCKEFVRREQTAREQLERAEQRHHESVELAAAQKREADGQLAKALELAAKAADARASSVAAGLSQKHEAEKYALLLQHQDLQKQMDGSQNTTSQTKTAAELRLKQCEENLKSLELEAEELRSAKSEACEAAESLTALQQKSMTEMVATISELEEMKMQKSKLAQTLQQSRDACQQWQTCAEQTKGKLDSCNARLIAAIEELAALRSEQHTSSKAQVEDEVNCTDISPLGVAQLAKAIEAVASLQAEVLRLRKVLANRKKVAARQENVAPNSTSVQQKTLLQSRELQLKSVESALRDSRLQSARDRALISQQNDRYDTLAATCQELRTRLHEVTRKERSQVTACSRAEQAKVDADERVARCMEELAISREREQTERQARELAESRQRRNREAWEEKVRDAQNLVREAEVRVQSIEERAVEVTTSAHKDALRAAADMALNSAASQESDRMAQLRMQLQEEAANKVDTEVNLVRLEMQQVVADREQEIAALQNQLATAADKAASAQRDTVASMDAGIASVRSDMQQVVADREREIAALQIQLAATSGKAVSAQQKLAASMDAGIASVRSEMQQVVADREQEITALQNQLATAADKAASAQRDTVASMDAGIASVRSDMQQVVADREREIAALRSQLAATSGKAVSAQQEMMSTREQLASAEARAQRAEAATTAAKLDFAKAGERATQPRPKQDADCETADHQVDVDQCESLLRENTELRVIKMRAETDLHRAHQQLQFNNILYEELQLEARGKDERIAVLEEKLATLRHHSRAPILGVSQSSSPSSPDLLVEPDATHHHHNHNREGPGSGHLRSEASGASIASRRSHSSDVNSAGVRSHGASHGHRAGAAGEIPPVSATARTRAAFVEYGSAKDSKIHDLECSVEELVQRLQVLSRASGAARHADQRSLQELRWQLRSSRGQEPAPSTDWLDPDFDGRPLHAGTSSRFRSSRPRPVVQTDSDGLGSDLY
jgi:hypothetical protein